MKHAKVVIGIVLFSLIVSALSWKIGYRQGLRDAAPTPAELASAINAVVNNAASIDESKPCAQATGNGSAAITGNGNNVKIEGEQ